jgi:Ca2+-binding RTX toxin-like protein
MARAQIISGTDAGELLVAGSGNDFLYGHGGNDELQGSGGDDQLQGGAGDDQLYGGAGRDRLYGQEGADFYDGGDGADQLFAGGIVGGGDTLKGGQGADLFAWVGRFTGVDTVLDFQRGSDKIDLSRIDADERTTPGTITGKNTPGNEAFTISSAPDGVTPGLLVFSSGVDDLNRPITIISGYTDTIDGVDFEIHLLGAYNLTSADFIL